MFLAQALPNGTFALGRRFRRDDDQLKQEFGLIHLSEEELVRAIVQNRPRT